MKFTKYLRNKGLSKSTVEMYYYHTMEYLTFLDVDNTEVENSTAKEIMLFLNQLNQRELSQESKKVRLYAIKHYYDYLVENQRITINPAKRIKLNGKQQQKLYPILTRHELDRLTTCYQVPNTNDANHHKNWFKSYRLSKERNKVILSLLTNQGITTAEVSRILLEDLDLRKGEIHIRGGRMLNDIVLELKSSQIMDLMEYQTKTRNELLKYHVPNTKYLFLSVPSSGKQRAKGNGSLQIWKSLSKELKEQEPKFVKIRQIRNSVITHWLKQYNLRQVQYRAGHKHIYSTEMYQINDIESLQKEVEQYHPI